MRGKPIVRGCVARDPGITPAHAGKTHVGSDARGAVRDHPRACGENMMADTCVA